MGPKIGTQCKWKAREVSTQYAYFLSSTLSDPLNAMRGRTQYFGKLQLISCYELLSASPAVVLILHTVCMVKTAPFQSWMKRVCLWTEEHAPLMSFFVSSKWKWSTCFVASVCCTQQRKRPNYQQGEPGLCVWDLCLFTSLSFHCIQIFLPGCKHVCIGRG